MFLFCGDFPSLFYGCFLLLFNGGFSSFPFLSSSAEVFRLSSVEDSVYLLRTFSFSLLWRFSIPLLRRFSVSPLFRCLLLFCGVFPSLFCRGFCSSPVGGSIPFYLAEVFNSSLWKFPFLFCGSFPFFFCGGFPFLFCGGFLFLFCGGFLFLFCGSFSLLFCESFPFLVCENFPLFFCG